MESSIHCPISVQGYNLQTATGMEDCNPNSTPAALQPLGSDPDGPPMQEKWSYPSIVGMLLYLSTNTRPDIAFAVSQVCRFTSNPKKSHATAVKHIIRYLAGTINNGTIFHPKMEYRLHCYVDADFAGLHGREPQDSPISVKSRTGYIITWGGCILIWKSQLQTETALSTFHSEYISLAAAARTTMCIQRVATEILRIIQRRPTLPLIHARLHEDNNSAYLLANNQQLSSRSRHLNVKFHFFWEQIGKTLEVVKIDTKEQRGDTFTKSLPTETFRYLRKLIQGW